MSEPDRPGLFVEISVALDDQAPDDVLDHLRAAGVEHIEALPDLGLVTGLVALTGVETVGRIAGVAGVERGRQIGVPPPESDLQ